MNLSIENLRILYLLYLRFNLDCVIGDYISSMFFSYSVDFLKVLFSDNLLQLHLTKPQIEEIVEFICKQ